MRMRMKTKMNIVIRNNNCLLEKRSVKKIALNMYIDISINTFERFFGIILVI